MPPLAQLIGLLLVPVKIKVTLIVGLEHAVADGARFLQPVLQVMEYFSVLIDLFPPLL